MLAPFCSVVCPDDPSQCSIVCFSTLVCFYCSGSVFGIIFKLKNEAITIVFALIIKSILKRSLTPLTEIQPTKPINSGELLVKTTLKKNYKTLSPWKPIKNWGKAQEFCTLLYVKTLKLVLTLNCVSNVLIKLLIFISGLYLHNTNFLLYLFHNGLINFNHLRHCE